MYVGLARQNFPATIAGVQTSQVCKTCEVLSGLQEGEIAQSNVTVSGNITPLFVDENGQKLGVINGEIVSDIPGASIKIIPMYNPDSPDAVSPIVYELPLTASYTLQAYADVSGSYTVTAFAAGVATELSNLETSAGSTDNVTLGTNLREVTLSATGNDKDYCYFFADDTLNDASRSFELCTTTSAGGQATFNVANNNNEFTFQNNGQPTDYNLIVNQTGQNGGSQVYTGTVTSNGSARIVLSGSTVYLPIIVK